MPIPNIENFAEIALGFEGVLADPKQARIEARRAAFVDLAMETGDRRFNHVSPELYEEAYDISHRSIDAVSWMLQRLDIADSDESHMAQDLTDLEYVEYIHRASNGLTEIPGSVSFVKSLAQAASGRLSIVANGFARTEVFPFLSRQKIGDEKYFLEDHIVGREHVSYSQPSPDSYNELIRRLEINRDELLAIVGTPKSAESARRSGAYVVAVANIESPGEFRKPVKREVRPHTITRDFKTLKRMMKLRAKAA